MPNQRALISKGRIRRRNLGSGRCDGTNSSPLAPNRSVFLLSPATQSGPPLFPTPLPLFKTAKIRFFVGFVIRYRGNLMGRENSEDTLQLSPHSISTFPIPIRATHPPFASLPFLPSPIPLFLSLGYKSAPPTRPPDTFLSRREWRGSSGTFSSSSSSCRLWPRSLRRRSGKDLTLDDVYISE